MIFLYSISYKQKGGKSLKRILTIIKEICSIVDILDKIYDFIDLLIRLYHMFMC